MSHRIVFDIYLLRILFSYGVIGCPSANMALYALREHLLLKEVFEHLTRLIYIYKCNVDFNTIIKSMNYYLYLN